MILKSNRILKFLIFAAGILFFIPVGFLDYYTGFDISILLFYLIPVCLTAYFSGFRPGLSTVIIGSAVWTVIYSLTNHTAVLSSVFYWNSALTFCIMLLNCFLSYYLNKKIRKEKEGQQKDYMTGLPNRMAFLEMIEHEIVRSKRYSHALTVAYIDIDNIKQLNAAFGIQMGDSILKISSKTIKDNVRVSDFVSRIDDHTFAAVFPETKDDASVPIINKIRNLLAEIKLVKENPFDITFSVGCITFETIPENLDELINKMNGIMDSIKQSGKNSILFEIYDVKK
jgi:diguanylate cyclase (GGDEF)-like protein